MYAARIALSGRSLLATAAVRAAAVLTVVVAGCSGDDPSKPVSKDPVKQATYLGACLRFSPGQDPKVTTLPTIDCAQAHTHEVYALLTSDKTEVYPGFDVLETRARIGCVEEFEKYVGIGAFDSLLFYTWLVPTIDGWNDPEAPDRETLCMLGARNGEPLKGSQKGSKL
jgi:hypothetical protein